MATIISVDEIEDGMILADPILNKFGQNLLPSGASLIKNNIKLLKTWNIRAVTVKTEDDEIEVDFTPEILALAEEKLKKRMKWLPRNLIEKDIYNMGLKHLAKTLMTKKRSE